MTVLTLAGKQIDWSRPPKATDRVRWSKPDRYGRAVTGSLRTIAHLDRLDSLAQKKFGTGIVILQPPYNKGVAASAGTHDYDACYDWYIPGVHPDEQQSFARANGLANWRRKPPTFSEHQHGFPLPPVGGSGWSTRFLVGGFKVGKYVDGGWSLFGKAVASSQISDYYERRTGLAGHLKDPSWFPPNIDATIFDLDAYIARKRFQQAKVRADANAGPDELALFGSHGPLARLGGAAGQALWDQWEVSVRNKMTSTVRNKITSVFVGDTNKRGALPNLGAALRRIGGRGIDLLAVREAAHGAKIKVLRRKTVNLHIDGHDGHGTKVKITFPSGQKVKVWLVHANLGRGVTNAVFRRACWDLRRGFGRNAVYFFNEIDEADMADEARILGAVFPDKHFAVVGKNSLTPIYVGTKRLRVKRRNKFLASSGMAKVSPARFIVKAVIAPK